MIVPRLIQRIREASAYAVPRLSFMTCVGGMALWLIYTRIPPEKDWRLFRDTATLLLSGRVGEIYPGVTPSLPFFYPPYFIWQTAFLGLLSPRAAYLSIVAVMFVAMLVGVVALRSTLDMQRKPVGSWIFVLLSSASWLWMLSDGQISAWYVMLLSVAMLLWVRNKRVWAGAVLSLLMIKPNYGGPILLCLLLGRAWAVLGGALSGLALLLLSTVPLGWHVWVGYISQFKTIVGAVHEVPAWKQVTMYAFWLSCMGSDHPRLLIALWLLTAAPGLLLVGSAWFKTDVTPDRVPRLLGITVLMLVCYNFYAFHYDGLLLAVPGVVWYLRPDSYRSQRSHFVIGVVIFLVYLGQHLSAWILQRGLAVTGPLIAAWLIADASDLLRRDSSEKLDKRLGSGEEPSRVVA